MCVRNGTIGPNQKSKNWPSGTSGSHLVSSSCVSLGLGRMVDTDHLFSFCTSWFENATDENFERTIHPEVIGWFQIYTIESEEFFKTLQRGYSTDPEEKFSARSPDTRFHSFDRNFRGNAIVDSWILGRYKHHSPPLPCLSRTLLLGLCPSSA